MDPSHPIPARRSLLAQIFLSPDEPRLRAGWRLLAQLSLMTGLSLILVLPAFLLLAILPVDGLATGTTLSLTDPAILIGVGIQILAAVLSVYVARRYADRRSFVSLGLAWSRTSAVDLLFGIGLAGVMIGLIFLTEWTAGWLRFEGFVWGGVPLSRVFLNTLAMLGAFTLVGWYEEVLFRGYWLRNLTEGLNPVWGAVLSSLAFAVGHAANPGFGPAALAGLTLAGLLFVYATRTTGGLWLAIGLHIGWNFFEGTVFGFQVSGLEDQIFRLTLQTINGPDLWTGGGFGPEAGLVLLPALGLAALAISAYARGRKDPTREAR